MTEAGHEDRTLLDMLAPLFAVEDASEPPAPLILKARSVVQGAIIGQLLPRFAEDEVPEPVDINAPLTVLSRSYLDV
jgi:hypothetical protein